MFGNDVVKQKEHTQSPTVDRQRQLYEKADELYHKHEDLSKAEAVLNEKFEKAKAKLMEYQAKFLKNKASLQQDHDTFVKIKQQTEKDLHD